MRSASLFVPLALMLAISGPLAAQEVTETLPPEIALASEGFTLEGRVRNGGNRIAGALVRIVEDGSWVEGAALEADDEGRFTIRGLAGGRLELGISHPQPDGGEPEPWAIAYHTVEIAGDLQRDFQIHRGRELEVQFTFPPGYSEEFVDLYDHVRLILAEWPEDMGDVNNRQDRRRVSTFFPSRLIDGTARFRGFFKGDYVVEFQSFGPLPRPPEVFSSELVRLDTIEEGGSIQVAVPPPGRLEFRIHGDIEALTDRDDVLFIMIRPEAARDFVGISSVPMVEDRALIDPLPSGRYVFAPVKIRLNGARGTPVVFDPAASTVEIREGETSIVEIDVKAARFAEFEYKPERNSSRGVVTSSGFPRSPTVERVRIYGPRYYDLVPDPMGLDALSYLLREKLKGGDAFAHPQGFRLINPPPGEYMAEVVASGFQTLTHSFVVSDESNPECQAIRMKPLP